MGVNRNFNIMKVALNIVICVCLLSILNCASVRQKDNPDRYFRLLLGSCFSGTETMHLSINGTKIINSVTPKTDKISGVVLGFELEARSTGIYNRDDLLSESQLNDNLISIELILGEKECAINRNLSKGEFFILSNCFEGCSDNLVQYKKQPKLD